MPEDREAVLRQAYRDAVAALPLRTRDIFLAHRVDGDELAAIADRHVLPIKAVERHVADALIAIDKALRRAGC